MKYSEYGKLLHLCWFCRKASPNLLNSCVAENKICLLLGIEVRVLI